MGNQHENHKKYKIIVWILIVVILLGIAYLIYSTLFRSSRDTTSVGDDTFSQLDNTNTDGVSLKNNSSSPFIPDGGDNQASQEGDNQLTSDGSNGASNDQSSTTPGFDSGRRVGITVGLSSKSNSSGSINTNVPSQDKNISSSKPSTSSSDSTALVNPTNPTNPTSQNNPSSITVSGVPRVGQTLAVKIVDADGVPATGVTYKWLANNVRIDGATTSSYTLTTAEVGKAITVQVSFTDNKGHSESSISAATTAVVVDTPTSNTPATVAITGLAEVGRTLVAYISDADGVPDISGVRRYQWYANDVAISGATSFSYQLQPADKGKTITVKTTFIDGKNNTENATSSATAAVTEASSSNKSGNVTIAGINRVGQTFVASVTDGDGVPSSGVTYRWYEFYGKFLGTGQTLTQDRSHIGMQILVQVDYVDNAGNKESVTSRLTGAVTDNVSGGTGAGITSPVADAPKITLTGPATVSQGSAAVYTVTLDKVSDKDVSADIRIDYGTSNSTKTSVRWDMQRVTVRAGQTSANIYVDTTTDSAADGNKVYSVSIDNAVYGTVNQANVSPISNTVTAQSVFMLSYRYPIIPGTTTFNDYWQAIHTAGSNKIPYVLLMADVTPSATIDPGYVTVLKKNSELGFKSVVYIRTNHQTRPIAEVKAAVEKAFALYGKDKIDGFYFDEITARNNAATAYLAELYNYVKSMHGAKLVVANPGAHITDAISPYADLFMTNESTADVYVNNYTNASSAFENNPANAHRIMHTVYDVRSSDYQQIINLTRSRNAGWVYISSDSIYPDGRPYNDLPESFSSLVNSVNNLGTLPANPNRSATLPVLTGANIGNNSVSTIITK